MPRTERNRMSLNTVGFQPTVFNALDYKPAEIDYSPLAKSFALQEERKERAAQQQSIVKQTLGKVREQLHEDEETAGWFNNYTKNIENDINNAVSVGDYSNALIKATNAAGNILNDPEVIARIRTNQEYEEELKVQQARRDRGDISQDTYAWWVKENPYKFVPITDDNGNVTGSQKYEPTSRPVNDIDWPRLYMSAKQMLTPQKGSSGYTGNVDKSGNAIGTKSSNNYQFEKLTPQAITDAAAKILAENFQGVVQDFNVKLFQIEKLKGEIEKLEAGSTERQLKEAQLATMQELFTGANGLPLTNDEAGWKIYTERMITNGLYSEGLAYDWRFSESSRIADSDYTPGGGSGLGGFSYNMGNRFGFGTMMGGYNEMYIGIGASENNARRIGASAGLGFGTPSTGRLGGNVRIVL